MQPKKAKNSAVLRLLFVALALVMLSPAQGHAGAFNPDQQAAAFGNDPERNPAMPDLSGVTDTIRIPFIAGVPNFSTCQAQAGGFTKAIVMCIRDTIIYTVYEQLGVISVYIAKTVAAACFLAIILWGAMILSGKTTALVKDGFILYIKIGAVALMTWNFGGQYGFFPLALGAMEDLVTLVSQYAINSNTLDCSCLSTYSNDTGSEWMVWDIIDCAVETLVGGIFSQANLAAGFTGFLVAAFFSASPGLFVAIIGLLIIAQLLFAILRAVYIFLSAYIGFALMVLISPLFIPLILFKSTNAYFQKWLKATLGFMLQPMFLFAYLSMMLAAFDTVVFTGTDNTLSLYQAISGKKIGDDIGICGDAKNIGSWLTSNNVYVAKQEAQQSINTNPSAAVGALLQNNQEINSGALNDITAAVASTGDELQAKITSFPGFTVGADVTAVNWANLSEAAGAGENDDRTASTNYTVQLFLSLLMALFTGFIFMKMLDFLPFIGNGISSETLSMQALGVGKMGPPGEDAMNTLKSKYSLRPGG